MTTRHKTFISFHSKDMNWKDQFVEMMGKNYIVDRSVGEDDIPDNIKTETINQKIRDEFIADATVLVVLIGPETWGRKYIDWEIGSGIRATKNNPRCGLIGIWLPNHPDYSRDKFEKSIIPPRLYDNHKSGFAKLYDWTEDPFTIQNWIHEAFERRNEINPINNRDQFKNNRTGDGWS